MQTYCRLAPEMDLISRSARCVVDEGNETFEQRGRRGRAAADVEIYRNHLIDRADHRVAALEHAAPAAASADRDHPFWIRGSRIGALERDLHVARYRAGHHEHVGVARRGDEADAEALDVVDGIVEGMDLELAAVARAGIDLANG